MNRIGPLISVGKIVKPHGVDGGMKVALKDTFEGLDLSEQFVFVNFEGLPVPFWTMAFDSKGFDQISLEHINSKEDAKSFAGKELFVEQKLIASRNDQTSNPYTWIGYLMMDLTSNQSGEIINLEEYPQQLIATVKIENQEVLIPIHEDFLVAVDDLSQLITVKLPEGLFG